MKATEVLKEIEENFFSKLESKTGWGRNEIKQTYKDSVKEVLMAAIFEQEDTRE